MGFFGRVGLGTTATLKAQLGSLLQAPVRAARAHLTSQPLPRQMPESRAAALCPAGCW